MTARGSWAPEVSEKTCNSQAGLVSPSTRKEELIHRCLPQQWWGVSILKLLKWWGNSSQSLLSPNRRQQGDTLVMFEKVRKSLGWHCADRGHICTKSAQEGCLQPLTGGNNASPCNYQQPHITYSPAFPFLNQFRYHIIFLTIKHCE